MGPKPADERADHDLRLPPNFEVHSSDPENAGRGVE